MMTASLSNAGLGLLPCPFCGAEPMIEKYEGHQHHFKIGDFKMPDFQGCWAIECVKCEFRIFRETNLATILAWNTRTRVSLQNWRQKNE
jgi:hypothetical protein